jgi:hypothetical protein
MNNIIESKQKEKMEFPTGVSLSLGVAIGAGIGVALGIAMDNFAVGIAIGIGSGLSIGAGVENSAQNRRQGIDTPLAKKQKKLAFLSIGIGILSLLAILMYFIVEK